MMGAKDSGFILQESHNAVMEEMSGHVGINSRKRIIEEIHFFVLDKKKAPRRFRSIGVILCQAELNWSQQTNFGGLIFQTSVIVRCVLPKLLEKCQPLSQGFPVGE